MPDEIRQQLGSAADKKIQYVRRVFGPAVMAGERLGVDPKFLMSQAALESGWGESELATKYHNYGGVKARKGQKSVAMMSAEGYGPTRRMEKSNFAVYESPNQFFESWTEFLNRPRYQAARQAKTPEEYAYALKAGGYYTEDQKKYARILNRATRDIDLIINNIQKLDPSILDSSIAGQTETR